MKQDRYQSYYRASLRLDREPIVLPAAEYAMVMHELNTHLSEEDRQRRVLSKPIGNDIYTVIRNGYDDYIVIAKHPIENVDAEWEES